MNEQFCIQYTIPKHLPKNWCILAGSYAGHEKMKTVQPRRNAKLLFAASTQP